jgi:hypothetical protein
MKQLCFYIIFILYANSVVANDSTYIKFAKRKMLINENYSFTSVSLKSKAMLFIPCGIDSINCFIFKRNRLIATGMLRIKNENNNKVGFREGYWFFYDKKDKENQIYYIDDEPQLIDIDIPVKKRDIEL